MSGINAVLDRSIAADGFQIVRERGKRRGQGEGTIRKRKDGRWEGRVLVPGRKRAKIVYGRTKHELQGAVARLRTDAARGLLPPERSPTLREYLDDWLSQHAQPRLRPRPYDSYRSVLVRHVIPELGRYRLQALTPSMVQGWLHRTTAERREPALGGLCPDRAADRTK